jgi:hypothetical protein
MRRGLERRRARPPKAVEPIQSRRKHTCQSASLTFSGCLDPPYLLCELSAGFSQCDVAAFNPYPSARSSELDNIGRSAIQLLDLTPLHGAPVRRVTQGADQLHGKRFGLAWHCTAPDTQTGVRSSISC